MLHKHAQLSVLSRLTSCWSVGLCSLQTTRGPSDTTIAGCVAEFETLFAPQRDEDLRDLFLAKGLTFSAKGSHVATSHLHGNVPDKTEYGDPATRQQSCSWHVPFWHIGRDLPFSPQLPKHCVPRISSASVVRTSMCLCRFLSSLSSQKSKTET